MMARNSPASGGCLAIFGLPFLAAGLFALVTGLAWWAEYVKSGSWERVPVEIRSANLEAHRGSKGSRTWSVSATYRYRFDRANPQSPRPDAPLHDGDRVDIESASSSGSEHRDRYDVLEHHRRTGKPFLAWVDPSDPARALLFREPTAIMYMLPMFGLTFTMIGGGLLLGGLWQGYRGSQKARRLRQDPARPWRAEPKFATGFTVRSTSAAVVATSWALALFLSSFMIPFCIALYGDRKAPWMAWAVVGLFTLVAAGFVVHAIYQTLRLGKYGVSKLELFEMPIVPGRELIGRVLVGRPLCSQEGVHLRVSGVRTVGSGKHATATEFFLAEQNAREESGFAGSGDTIAIRFPIPAGLPSREPDADTRVAYTLKISAATPGVDFEVEFDLPVYEVSDPSQVETGPWAHSATPGSGRVVSY